MLRVRLGVTATIFVLAAAALVLSTDSADAQGGRKGGRGGFGGRRGGGFRPTDAVSLIGSEQVQDELKVTDEQREEIEKIVDAYRGDSRDLMEGLADLSPEEREKKRTELEDKRKALTEDADKKVYAALKEDQVKRLKEIVLQTAGTRALLRPEVADALKLNDEQKTKIKAAIDSEDQQMRDAMASAGGGGGRRGRGEKGEKADKGDKGEQADKGEKGEKGEKGKGGRRGGGGGGNFGAMREQMNTLRKQTDEAVAKVLTPDQQKQLETMKGAKFELAPPQRGEGRKGGA